MIAFRRALAAPKNTSNLGITGFDKIGSNCEPPMVEAWMYPKASPASARNPNRWLHTPRRWGSTVHAEFGFIRFAVAGSVIDANLELHIVAMPKPSQSRFAAPSRIELPHQSGGTLFLSVPAYRT